MKLKIFVFAVFLTISGCIPQISTVTVFQKGKRPELNQKNTVDVGSTIYKEFNYSAIKAALLKDDINSSIAKISSNTTLSTMEINGNLVYYYSNNAGYSCILLSDSDDDGKFDQIKNGIVGIWNDISVPASYEETEGEWSSGGFMLELIYQGITNNNIKVAYREFNNDIARPAFTQVVDYELNEEGKGMIAFKGARIEVLKASTTTITYRVIKGFEL